MIAHNLIRIRQQIEAACVKTGRNPQEITLVAATKGRSIEQVQQALEFGITDIGESRIQEAIVKHSKLLNSQALRWHMLGHLQTNKVKEAVKIFDLIQSVDTTRLAAEIDTQAFKIHKIQDILVEVNISGELSKYGFTPEETIEAVKRIAKFRNLNIKGLMTIAPSVDNREETRPYFLTLRELQNKINALRITPACSAGRQDALRILSMGMSDDFEAAIEEGSTMIRLGRAIFSRQ